MAIQKVLVEIQYELSVCSMKISIVHQGLEELIIETCTLIEQLIFIKSTIMMERKVQKT